MKVYCEEHGVSKALYLTDGLLRCEGCYLSSDELEPKQDTEE